MLVNRQHPHIPEQSLERHAVLCAACFFFLAWMTVIAASILTRQGKVVLSRQFVPITRSVLESLLSGFVRLLDPGSQHTLVDGEHVRYMYQPLEGSLYLVLAMTKEFSVWQDIRSLHLVGRFVGDTCHPLSEESVETRAFEIVFAMDEAFCPLGIGESMSMSKLLLQLSMESQLEKIEETIAREKEKETRQKAKERSKQIEQRQREQAKRVPSPQYREVAEPDRTVEPVRQPSVVGKGMVLSSKKPAMIPEPLPRQTVEDMDDGPAPGPVEGVVIVEEERVSLVSHHEGGIEQFEVTGSLNVQISDARYGGLQIFLELERSRKIQYKTHPKIDRRLFNEQSIVSTMEPDQKWPLNQKLSIVRWRFVSQEESDIPLVLSCWPTYALDGYEVIVEYQLESEHMGLTDLAVSIPLPCNGSPSVKAYSGRFQWAQADRSLLWSIGNVDASNRSGSIEFSVRSSQVQGAFFPVTAWFRSECGFFPISVKRVEVDGEASPEFSFAVALETGEYSLV